MQALKSLRSKLSAIVCATLLAAAVSASAKEGETRTCTTTFGGQVVCGNLTIGITLEQYEARLVLVRPDQYVVWADDEAPSDADALLERITGTW